MKDLKSKIEAMLFCSSEGINTKSLAKLCGVGAAGHVKKAIQELQSEYEEREAGIRIREKEGLWFLAVRDRHLKMVQDAAKPEMDKAVLQTLAYIAHKKKIRQADVIRIRSNKAYDHIKQLEEAGFIEAKKDGSTRRLYPTKRFYAYFDLKEGEEIGIE